MQDDQVTGISRSGRVRKKSSKLMDFESPDDIETRYRRTPAKAFNPHVNQFRSEDQEYSNAALSYQPQLNQPRSAPSQPQVQPMEEGGTASEGESDYYENPGEPADSMDSDSSSDSAVAPPPARPANSLYMMEKSAKKKLIVKDGKVIGRAKAQRKDKGKTRITAYMMWAKEARNDLLRTHSDMDFSAISKRLGEMWSNVNYNERYLWKRKAKRFAMQKEQANAPAATKLISNSKPRYGQVGRPPANRAPKVASPPAPAPAPAPAGQALVPVSSALAGAAAAAAKPGAAGAAEVAAHLRLLGESLAIIGERLQEHEGQIAVSGSVSVLLDTLLCALAPLLGALAAVPAVAPPPRLTRATLHNVAYIMPGL